MLQCLLLLQRLAPNQPQPRQLRRQNALWPMLQRPAPNQPQPRQLRRQNALWPMLQRPAPNQPHPPHRWLWPSRQSR